MEPIIMPLHEAVAVTWAFIFSASEPRKIDSFEHLMRF